MAPIETQTGCPPVDIREWRKWTRIFVFIAYLGAVACEALAADANTPLYSWLNAQTNIQTWSAQVVQTRTLKSLTQPLTATGRVWFAAPNRFRWELGDPPQTIAIRQPDQMLVIYPRLKRAEKYPLGGSANGQWRDTLSLLEAGFPRTREELESKFHIISETATNGAHEVTLQPKSASARRLIPQIKVAFSTNDFSLRATEIQFADGSTMRNDFADAILNPKLEESIFTPAISSDFKVVEPLKPK
jgi:outer membrane lipoprotein-sorting protein